MAQRCDVCGKGPVVGHQISHAHNVTKRRWLPNLVSMRAVVNGRAKRVRVCTRCLRGGKVVAFQQYTDTKQWAAAAAAIGV